MAPALGQLDAAQASLKDPKDASKAMLIEQAANLIAVSIPTHSQPDQPAHAWANRGVSSSSVTKSYHYEDARFPQALTGISVQGQGSDAQMINQRLSTYLYNQRGQAVLSVKD